VYKLQIPQNLGLPLVQNVRAGMEIIWQKQGIMERKYV
jgi:hypothetical protein